MLILLGGCQSRISGLRSEFVSMTQPFLLVAAQLSGRLGEEALAEMARVFEMIAAEYREKGQSLPADTTEIVHA
jgi:hypothetical protein